MKNLYYIIIIMLAITACKQKTADELIVQNWTCVGINTTTLSNQVKDLNDQFSIELLKSNFIDGDLQFFKDKTYKQYIKTYDYELQGEYKMINDGKYMICKHLDARKEEKKEQFEIMMLTDDSLKLKAKEDYVLVYAKKDKL
jgi:hypothetical protein